MLCFYSSLVTLGVAIDPLIVSPSQYWDGIDGLWSTFWTSIGSPPRLVRLLPSTTGNSVWPVLPQGCTPKDPSNCADARGAVFNPENSTSWSDVGLYQLGLLEERALGYSGNASFGYDDVQLGADTSAPLASHQMIQAFATKDFYLGTIGLSPNAIDIPFHTETTDSLLSSLKYHGTIPSLSWGYTAGASYAQPPALGSLTLGGYDSSRFKPHNIDFPLGRERNRELLVYLNSVDLNSVGTAGPDSSSVINVGVYALLDSQIPDLWLPEDLCGQFGVAFGLEYNASANRYFINDTAHRSLAKLNISTSFVLGVGEASGDGTVNINIPYSSFDLTDKSRPVGEGDKGPRYFPLRRAQSASQYTIGRMFFQNAYVIADYERSKFSVHQAIFPDLDAIQTIVPKSPVSADTSKRNQTIGEIGTSPVPNKLSSGATAAIAVSGSFIALSGLMFGIWWTRRRRQLQAQPNETPEVFGRSSQDELRKPERDGIGGFNKIEISPDSERGKPELQTHGPWLKALLPEEVERWKPEPPGDDKRGEKAETYGSFAGHEAYAGIVIRCEADAGPAGCEAEGDRPPDKITELSDVERSFFELQGKNRYSEVSPNPPHSRRNPRAELLG